MPATIGSLADLIPVIGMVKKTKNVFSAFRRPLSKARKLSNIWHIAYFRKRHFRGMDGR